jgi:hypothetical protein
MLVDAARCTAEERCSLRGKSNTAFWRPSRVPKPEDVYACAPASSARPNHRSIRLDAELISDMGEGSPLQRIASMKMDGKVLEFARAGSYFGIVVRPGSAGPDLIAILRAGNVHGRR